MNPLEVIENLFDAYVALVAEGKGYLIIVPAYAGSMLLEKLIYLFVLRRAWSNGEALPNIVSAVGGLGIDTLMAIVFGGLYVYIYENYRLFDIPISGWSFLLAYLGFEFCHYWQHRLQHRVGLFWAVHQVHHSSNEMNLAVGGRFAWGVAITEPMYLLLPLLGFPILQFRAVNLLCNVYGIWNHSELIPKLGALEHVLMTPANHRAHHGRQPKYLDCNYGQSLLLFDKIFGSHQIEEERPDYGLVHRVTDRNPLRFQTNGYRDLWHKIRSVPQWRDKLLYLVKPPGWSHEGRHETTAALRASERQDLFHRVR